MSTADLLVLYLGAGLGFAVVVLRRAPPPRLRALPSAAMALLLWPVWAPLVLGNDRPSTAPEARGGHVAASSMRQRSNAAGDVNEAMVRVQTGLDGALEAVADTPLGSLLTTADVEQILGELARVSGRIDELDRHLGRYRSGTEPATAEPCPPGPAVSSRTRLGAAQLHSRSLARLRELRRESVAALHQLGELSELLHTELLLARFRGTDGSVAAAAEQPLGELVAELWSRLESLAEISAAHAEPVGRPSFPDRAANG